MDLEQLTGLVVFSLVPPNRPEQIPVADDFASSFGQRQQQTVLQWRQGDPALTDPRSLLAGIDAEFPDFIGSGWCLDETPGQHDPIAGIGGRHIYEHQGGPATGLCQVKQGSGFESSQSGALDEDQVGRVIFDGSQNVRPDGSNGVAVRCVTECGLHLLPSAQGRRENEDVHFGHLHNPAHQARLPTGGMITPGV